LGTTFRPICPPMIATGERVAEQRPQTASSPGPPAGEAGSLDAITDQLELWLKSSALPLWWAVGADQRRGGFHDVIDRAGCSVEGPRRARVQTRQTFVYAVAIRLDFEGPWRQASEHGLSYFLEYYRRPDGLFRAKVGPDGNSLDESAVLYEQAFALLAMAAHIQAMPDRGDLRAEAERLLTCVRATMGHPSGGFREIGAHPFQANAQMHLLEAALAWSEVDTSPAWPKLADELVDLALDHFIDPQGGFLREFFDADWNPAEGDDGRLVEPGHQFEWAWLLERWAQARESARAHEAAIRLFASGLRGVDEQRSVIVDELSDDLSPRSTRARLWPQTEYIRAALTLAQSVPAADAQPYLRCAHQGATGLRRYLDTSVDGLWHDKLRADDRIEPEAAPATSLYHIVGAIAAMMAYRDRHRAR
jgi:mannose-1-phosphate guanylyltransferase/mannose-6-phosphate isomerase